MSIIVSELRILPKQPIQRSAPGGHVNFCLEDRVCTLSKSRSLVPLDKIPSTLAIDSLPRTGVLVLDQWIRCRLRWRGTK